MTNFTFDMYLVFKVVSAIKMPCKRQIRKRRRRRWSKHQAVLKKQRGWVQTRVGGRVYCRRILQYQIVTEETTFRNFMTNFMMYIKPLTTALHK